MHRTLTLGECGHTAFNPCLQQHCEDHYSRGEQEQAGCRCRRNGRYDLHEQTWTPSFGQGFVTAKVESGSRFKLLRLLAFE